MTTSSANSSGYSLETLLVIDETCHFFISIFALIVSIYYAIIWGKLLLYALVDDSHGNDGTSRMTYVLLNKRIMIISIIVTFIFILRVTLMLLSANKQVVASNNKNMITLDIDDKNTAESQLNMLLTRGGISPNWECVYFWLMEVTFILI